jgi:hypothetical protein
MKTLAERLARTAPQAIDMHGYTWGHWRVVGKGNPKWNGDKSRASWVVRCECGTELTKTGTEIRSERARAHIRCWICEP